MSLYIAGDSYGSLDRVQPTGESWSEIAAEKLSTNLVNVARPAASNISIAIQLEWIYNNITQQDTVVVVLTDHLRITMLDEYCAINSSISLLEQHSTHQAQRVVDNIYKESNIVSSTVNNPVNHTMATVFNRSFDPLLQYFIDTHVLSGMFTKLYKKTSKLYVCQGGFGSRLTGVEDTQDFSHVLLLDKKSYLPISQNTFNNLCKTASTYINHLDSTAHSKLGSLIYSYIR